MPVNTHHPTYDLFVNTWQTLRDAYAGSDAVRAQGERYLPRPTGMRGSPAKEAAWRAYLQRPEWYNATNRTVKGLTGAVFRKDPHVEIPGGDGAEMLRQDVTGTGVFLLAFLEMALEANVHMGRYGIMLDWDATLEMPTWSGYPTECILNWDEEAGTFIVLEEQFYTPSTAAEDQVIIGDSVLSLSLKLVVQWRLLSLLPIGEPPLPGQPDLRPRIYRQDVFRQIEQTASSNVPQPQIEHIDSIIPTRRNQPLNFIPFVFLGPETNDPAISRSIVLDLVRLNLRYWRHSADYEHGLHLTCVPTPWITGHNPNLYQPALGEEGKQTEPVMVLGSGEAILLGEEHARIGLLTMSADDLGAMINALETDKKDMATLGARLLEERSDVEETATAVRLRHSGDESILKSVAHATSFAATQVLRWDLWWRGETEDPEDPRVRITLNTDFVSRPMDAQLMLAIADLQERGHMSEENRHYLYSQGEVIEPGVSYEEEKNRIAANPPVVMRLAPNGTNPLEDEEEDDEDA